MITNRKFLNHLDPDTDLASRKLSAIERVVEWIDSELKLSNKRLCDLSCGPGLYTQRFSEIGAKVTGVDFSTYSLEYAKSEAAKCGLSIRYVNADYLIDPLPNEFDVVSLIYCDFCVLSPSQRQALLNRIADMLNPGGKLVIDVAGIAALDQKSEITLCENQLMNGFWAECDYVGMQGTFIYPEQSLALDRYLIVEPNETWEIFNWFQHFTPSSLESELSHAGFEVEHMMGSLTGEKLKPDSNVIGVISRKH